MVLAAMLLFCFAPVSAQETKERETPEKSEAYRPKPSHFHIMPDVTLPASPEAVEEAARPISANEAAFIALMRQPKIAVARASIREARGRTKTVSSASNPLVTANMNYTAQSAPYGDSPSGGSSQGGASGIYGANAAISQLIFDFNHTRDLVRQSFAQERASAENLTRVQADVVLEVKQNFYRYLQCLELVKVYDLNYENQLEHLKMAEERYRAGVGLPSDVVRAQAAVSESIFSLTQAKTEAAIARVDLALSMGIDPRTPLQVVDAAESEIDLSEVNALYSAALDKRPEILQARANLEAADHALSAARSSNAPALSGQAGWTGRDTSLFPDYGYFNAGVVLSLTLSDGGAAAGRIEQAEAAGETLRSEYLLAEQTVVRDVSTSYLALQNAKQALVTAEAEVESAKEAHRLAQGRYRAGVGLLLDVLDAQSAVLRAETNAVNAQSVLNQARASIKWAIGSGLSEYMETESLQ